MVLNIQAIKTYTKMCGVKSILQTKPPIVKEAKSTMKTLFPLAFDVIEINKTNKISKNQLQQLTNTILQEAKSDYQGFAANLEKVFSNIPGKLVYGLKPEKSILRKLHERVSELKVPKEDVIQTAKELVPDLRRARIVLDTGSIKESDEIVELISKALDNRDLTLLETYSYGNQPYVQFQRHWYDSLNRGACSYKLKKSGYTGTHFKFLDKDNHMFELQIRGPKADKIANIEHTFYRSQRHDATNDLTNSNLQDVFEKMSIKEKTLYTKYIKSCYKHARAQELGIKCDSPAFPKGLDPVLELN